MLYVAGLAFIIFYIWIYYRVGVYATPLGGAFLLGWAAFSLGAYWMIIAVAAVAGWFLVFFILGLLRGMRGRWPFAGVLEMGLVFVPSALFSGAMVHMFAEPAGAIEAVVLGVIAGVFVGVVACRKHEERMRLAQKQNDQGAAE